MTKPRHFATALILSVNLASCSPENESSQNFATDGEVSPRSSVGHWTWEPGPHGSQVSFDKSQAVPDSIPTADRVTRCWPKEGLYDCLHVTGQPTDSGVYFIANRYQSSKLVTGFQHISQTPGGYGCEFFAPGMNISEFVSSAHGTLRSNTVDLGGRLPYSRPLDAEETKKLMRSNGVSPASYFDCTEVASRVFGASLAVLASTDVEYAMIMK